MRFASAKFYLLIFLIEFLFSLFFFPNLERSLFDQGESLSIEPRRNSFLGGLVADLTSSIDLLVGGTRSYQIMMRT